MDTTLVKNPEGHYTIERNGSLCQCPYQTFPTVIQLPNGQFNATVASNPCSSKCVLFRRAQDNKEVVLCRGTIAVGFEDRKAPLIKVNKNPIIMPR